MKKAPGTKTVKGNDYELKSEAMEKKRYKKEEASRTTAGIDTLMKKSKKPLVKKPKVKAQVKGKGLIK